GHDTGGTGALLAVLRDRRSHASDARPRPRARPPAAHPRGGDARRGTLLSPALRSASRRVSARSRVARTRRVARPLRASERRGGGALRRNGNGRGALPDLELPPGLGP